MINTNEIYNANCLELMKEIDDKSIDCIICDLPYGTTACSWDSILSFDELWYQYKRIRKDNCPIILFGSQPFTTKLINSNIEEFKYEWIWQKAVGSNFALLKYQPMKEHENICVFGKGNITYNPQMQDRHGSERGKVRHATRTESIGGCGGEVYGGIVKDRDTREYGELRYPSSIQFFQNRNPSDRGIHPTQKPIALIEYLVKTYSNENDLVLDNCSGSGTLAVACHNLKRNFICIEKDENYYKNSIERLKICKMKRKLF